MVLELLNVANYFSDISKWHQQIYIWMQERDVVLRAAVEENTPYPVRDRTWQGEVGACPYRSGVSVSAQLSDTDTA